MSKETSKAMRRRWCEDETGIFGWRAIFRGRAIDVGAGDDPLPVPADCIHFDQKDGDANNLAVYFQPGSFDLIHGSQVMEHLHNFPAALINWLGLLAPGGHLVASVPSWELYEHKRALSKWNPDHKSTFSTISRKGGKMLPHFFMPDTLHTILKVSGNYLLRMCRLLAENYDFMAGGNVDQTWEETAMVEPWIEFVIQRVK